MGNLIVVAKGKYRKDAGIPLPHPTTLMLELTNKCNLHCRTCPREHEFGRQMAHGNMDTALAKRIIDENYPYLQSIGLTGLGETLFATNLTEIARYIKSKKKSIVIAISTNANIPGFIETITPSLPYIDTVQISIDGIGRTYEEVRKGAKFEPVAENLKKLVPLARKHKVDLMFNMVLTKINYRQMAEVIEFASKVGVKYVNFNYVNLACLTEIPLEYYRFFETAEFLIAKDAARAAAEAHPETEVTGIEFWGAEKDGCPLLWNHFQINYDGKMPPCCGKPFTKEYCYGDANRQKVIDIINSDKARELRAAWIAGHPHKFCARCHFAHL